jgi:hypothetical protein
MILTVVLLVAAIPYAILRGTCWWLYRHDPDFRRIADYQNAMHQWRREHEGRDAMGGRWY